MQSGLVRTDNAKQLFRLVDECREVREGVERREHFLAAMSRLIRADVATEAVCVRDGHDVHWHDLSDYGWSSTDRTRVYEYVRSNPLQNDPLTWSAIQRLANEPLATTTRTEVMTQSDWANSEIRNDLHRPARLDESLVSVMRLGNESSFHFIVMKRAWGELAFAAEDRGIVHLAHSALASISSRRAPAASVRPVSRRTSARASARRWSCS